MSLQSYENTKKNLACIYSYYTARVELRIYIIYATTFLCFYIFASNFLLDSSIKVGLFIS